MDDVREYNREHGLSLSPEHRVLDLVAETGDPSKEVLKATDYGEGAAERSRGIEDEIGDVYYALLSLADEFGVDPEVALAASLEKYSDRADESGGIGSGG